MLIRLTVLLVIAGSLQNLVEPLKRKSNSAVEVRRGIEHYQKKDNPAARKSFQEAAKLHPGPLTSFDLGTAEVATGNIPRGIELLTRASEDATLRPDAVYNRGNGALSANQLDAAIADYVATLKIRPKDKDAKRNLEIAQMRRQSSQRPTPQQPSEQKPDPQQQDQEQQNEPNPGNQEGEKREETDAESLLRSVEEQEREELSRMRRSRPQPMRVGW
jgi:tetratricopeptide (TPR) repeat protein